MIDNKLWQQISNALESHHAIFYKLWQMGKPEFSKEIDTAAVKFDKEGNYLIFLFNLNFWNSLDFYNKLFVVCHECLHVILNHGARIQDSKNSLASNQSLDIVVNHLLVEKFSFKRNSINNWQDFCWADTVFPDQKVSINENYEFYFNLFKKQYGDGYPLRVLKTVDDHNFNEDTKYIFEENLDISNEEKNYLFESLEKHSGDSCGTWVNLEKKQIIKKKKWENVIKKWSVSILKQSCREVDQWTRLNRRLSMLPKNMFLPSEMEIEDLHKEKDKIEVYFFLDCSESCWHLKDRFFSAADSLPCKKFKIHLFCFDTKIEEISLESRKVYGRGGTSFNIIEKYIKRLPKYPEGIFVITDGYGDNIHPQKPKNWHWFLTDDSTKYFISKECNIYKLSDFV